MLIQRFSGVLCLNLGLMTAMGKAAPATATSSQSPSVSGAPKPPTSTPGPRVAAGIQETVLQELGQGPWDEAWGLFSTGGWSDVGQVIVFAVKDGTRAELRVIKPNDTALESQAILDRKTLKKLKKEFAKAASLKDVDEDMFDGLIFEYIHVVRDGAAGLKLVKRLYYKSNGREPHPVHETLIKTLSDLKNKKS